jgi:hypothetical protein
MKAISLHQPWASAVAIGIKTHETRSWRTSHLGPLAIHAAKKRTLENERIFQDLWDIPEIGFAFADHLDLNFNWLPFGAIIATCKLTCVGDVDFWKPTEIQKALGNYSPGRFVWVLEDIKKLDAPIPFKGQQGFFEVPDSLLQ